MSTRSRSNWGRWILGFQALVFFFVGGIQVWAFPAEACPYMARSRGVLEERVECPAYVGEQPVFEMYTFSLGKHVTLIGVVFLYFAVRGRSRAAIQVGLLYAPVALLVDWVPVVTWFSGSGAGDSTFPPIFWLAVLSCVLSGAGLVANARHLEWSPAADV